MQFIINIDVPDARRAAAFYESAFGLRTSRLLFEGTVAELAGGPAPIYLLQKEPGSPAFRGAGERRRFDRHWTPVHLDVIVDAIEPALERALRAGATLEGKVQDFAWGRLAVLGDPFGNGICLLQWRGRGYDEVRDQDG